MGDIVYFSKYKQPKKNNIVLSKLSEGDIANQILESFNYNNRNIIIPIVKIAKNSGLKVYYENFDKNGDTSVIGKLFMGGTTEQSYGCNQVILVNRNDPIFEQRVVVARMLGCYLIEGVHKKYHKDQKVLLSTILNYGEIYNKYEEFILNILAPNQIFIKQHNIAVNVGLPRMEVYMYLSRFFEVPDEFVQRKVKSLTKRRIDR